MKRVLLTLAALGIAGIFLLADAQPCPMCPGAPGPGFRPMRGPEMGMGPRREMMRGQMMENGERETIRGRVVSIEPMRRGPGIRLKIESDSRVVSVVIPPAMPLDQLDEEIERGDRIEVSGARVMRMGESMLVATRIQIEESGESIHLEPPMDGPPDRDGPPMPPPRPMHPRAI